MGDKKRKVIDDPAEEPIAPEGKKLKKDKKETADAGAEHLPAWKVKSRKERQEKKERKREKKAPKEKRKRGEVNENPGISLDAEEERKRKEKKERKDKKYNSKKLKKAGEEVVKNDQEEPVENDEPMEEEVLNEVEEASAKAARFICFVGS